LISLRLPRAKADPSIGSVIHAINMGVYEISYMSVNPNLLKLKKYGRHRCGRFWLSFRLG